MPAAKPGDIWRVDLGMAAKVRPCLILTGQPRSDELDVFTIVAHTPSLRGNHWEISVPKSFLKDEGAFDVQRIATVASVKLERKLGELTSAEMGKILDLLAERLGI
jgi:mRNA interferase MazF